MITFELSRTDSELVQIIDLQQRNRLDAVADEQRATEGFVTMAYTIDELRLMSGGYRHVLAKSGGLVVAYALVMLKQCRASFPFLDDMFDNAERAVFKGMPMRDSAYCFMGQVCVDQAFRGNGVFRQLYQTLREQMRADFDCVITEVSLQNLRSLRAHERVGFKQIMEGGAGASEWRVIAWDWS